jgi:hypothetical protein
MREIMLGADKNFTELKQLIKTGKFEEFKQELNKVPEPFRTDLITRNPDTQINTLLVAVMPEISEDARDQLYAKYLQPEQIQAISQVETIDEKNRLFRIYFNDQPDRVPSFLLEAIEAMPEVKRKKVLRDNHCPIELSEPKKSEQEKQDALSKYLSKRRSPNSLLIEALINGKTEIFEYLKTQGANPQLLIFDSTDRTHFDGQHLPFVGNVDAFTSDPIQLQAYKTNYQLQFQSIYNMLDELNNQWDSKQKNDNRLLNIAVFFGHKELVEKLLKDPGIDPDLLCSRERPAITHASTNTDFRGEILDLMINHKKVMTDGTEMPSVKLDDTGMARYALINLNYEEFQRFIVANKDRLSQKEFEEVSFYTTLFNSQAVSAFNTPKEVTKKIQLLFDNNLLDIKMFKNQFEQFLPGLVLGNEASLEYFLVVSKQFEPEDYPLKIQAYSQLNFQPEDCLFKVAAYNALNLKDNLLDSLQNAKGIPDIWNGLVKRVSTDPELQKFLEASAGVSKDIDELNKAVQTYNSRSIGKRIADGITGFFTRTNKQHVQDTNELMKQIKETHTNAVSLGIPSLMVDKLVTDLHKANDGVEKDRALEQIRSNAGLFKGSSFENLVQVAEQKIKDKRAPEIAKLMEGMDKIDLKLKKMDHKKKMFTIIAEGTLEAVAQIPKDQSKRGGRKLLKVAAESILKQLSQDGVLVNFNPEQKKLLKLEIQDIMQRRLEEPIPSTSLTTALEGLKKGEKLEEVAQQGLAKRVVAVCTHYTQLAEKTPPQVAKTRQPELQKKKFTQTVRESQAIPTSQTAVSA